MPSIDTMTMVSAVYFALALLRLTIPVISIELA